MLFMRTSLFASTQAYLVGMLQDQVLQRCFAMERITSVACTLDGMLLCGGGASGAVYVWEVASGRLLRNWAAHYKVRYYTSPECEQCERHKRR
jgi:hypothetical protein